MILILEATGPEASQLGSASRREFPAEGGIIGRDKSSDWVLPHTKVSGHHARITFLHGLFHIEDTSRNGVFLNSPKNRLDRGRPYGLKSGDRIYIDPYVIDVSVSSGRNESSGEHYSDLPGLADPFAQPGFHSPTPPIRSARRDTRPEVAPGQEVDPLKLLDPALNLPPARKAPSAQDLEHGSPFAGHYKPPSIPTPPPHVPAPGAPVIPPDYDPMSPDVPVIEAPPRSVPREDYRSVAESHIDIDIPLPTAPPPARIVHTPTPPAPAVVRRAAEDARTPAVDRESHTSALAAVLAGAGLDNVAVTDEFARDFGEILRVVVSGVMDVLRSRQQIKDEFRMRLTQFRPADNNPLKFSANVDDALHNLLVKRNAAYLAPVEAFEDAFDDLRHHQIAMLAGMRVAFEAMLAAFDADHLQQEFDRQLKRGSLLGVTAKLRYWDLYSDKCRQLSKDPDTSFRKLFGEEFAKAYEEQLTRLKGESRASDGVAKPSE